MIFGRFIFRQTIAHLAIGVLLVLIAGVSILSGGMGLKRTRPHKVVSNPQSTSSTNNRITHSNGHRNRNRVLETGDLASESATAKNSPSDSRTPALKLPKNSVDFIRDQANELPPVKRLPQIQRAHGAKWTDWRVDPQQAPLGSTRLVNWQTSNSEAPSIAKQLVQNLSELPLSQSVEIELGSLKNHRLSKNELEPFRIISVTPETNPVCEVIEGEKNQLKLIGTAIGQTKISVTAQVGVLDDPASVKEFSVNVIVVPSVTARASANRLVPLRRALDKLYAGCRVQLTASDDAIVASGACDNEANARRILSLVRRTCMVPVVDQLDVPTAPAEPVSPLRLRPGHLSGDRGFGEHLGTSGISAFPLIECTPVEVAPAVPSMILNPWMLETGS